MKYLNRIINGKVIIPLGECDTSNNIHIIEQGLWYSKIHSFRRQHMSGTIHLALLYLTDLDLEEQTEHRLHKYEHTPGKNYTHIYIYIYIYIKFQCIQKWSLEKDQQSLCAQDFSQKKEFMCSKYSNTKICLNILIISHFGLVDSLICLFSFGSVLG